MSRDLTQLENEVYELIKRSGEMLTTSVPDKMRGAIPNLVNKGLVEVYKRRTSPWSEKKSTYLRAKGRLSYNLSCRELIQKESGSQKDAANRNPSASKFSTYAF